MARVNKEKSGQTKRFSIRIPTELHSWVKTRSESSVEYLSMNEIITDAIREYIIGKEYMLI
jgi:metal-responsive CopG/Arc/MetJ family transcriptional regulator